MKKALLALVLSFWASVASAQNVVTDFESFAPGTAVEALAIPGVTFSSAPPGGWTVTTFVGFALLTNGLVNTIAGDVLTADFAPGHSAYRFDFATNGAGTVQVTGFRGGVLVFTHTYTGAIPPGIAFPEGTAAASGIIFDRLVIEGLGGLQFGIDNLAVTGASSIPTLSQWGLILLAGLMGIGAFATMRRQRQA
jgi:IPTL-CTERM motif